MRPSIQQLYPVFGLLVVAGASLWLERITAGDETRASAQVRSEPDSVAEGTRLVSFDHDGRQRYELLADRITHFPQTQVTALERPRLVYVSDGRELRVSARSGEAQKQGDVVRLAGEVRALRAAAAGSPELSFASESLTVWPDDERAETGDPVVLTQGASTAHANGMKSDNLFGTLELIGNARVHIPRTSRTSP